MCIEKTRGRGLAHLESPGALAAVEKGLALPGTGLAEAGLGFGRRVWVGW